MLTGTHCDIPAGKSSFIIKQCMRQTCCLPHASMITCSTYSVASYTIQHDSYWLVQSKHINLHSMDRNKTINKTVNEHQHLFLLLPSSRLRTRWQTAQLSLPFCAVITLSKQYSDNHQIILHNDRFGPVHEARICGNHFDVVYFQLLSQSGS